MAGETAAQKLTAKSGAEGLAQALERLAWPTDAFGTPLVRISAAAAELVPTQQYGNATIGPVIVEKFVPDNGDIKAQIKILQAMVEAAVAEDRQTLHEQLRQRAAAGG